MTGESNLDKILKILKPTLNVGEFVFCTTQELEKISLADIILFFREEEGFTIVLEKNFADRLHLEYTFIASWITLSVHSSLDAVGLTAAFSKALAKENISCNVVAGYFHDHIFIDRKDAATAMNVLNKLALEI